MKHMYFYRFFLKQTLLLLVLEFFNSTSLSGKYSQTKKKDYNKLSTPHFSGLKVFLQ